MAEELVFGDISTGAQDDLQHATDLAHDMVTHFGMGDSLGLATYEEPQRSPFLGDVHFGDKGYSDETARSVDLEVRKLLEAAHERARVTLSQHERALRALARRLIEKEVVDRATLSAVIKESETPMAAFKSITADG